ncbi:MAG: UDP-N-acetylmuramoyl-L-alanine--D-glutamate ligase [bacterium]|nr:UDP-N-acetylmuramoyl-L-alanine--D-glutamate ligase [bacterium]
MHIAILGYGVEGKSAEKFLKSSLGCRTPKCRIEIRDIKKQGKDYLKNLEKFDMVVRSPGIPFLRSEIQKAKKKGVEITSTTKLFFENAKGILVGITGTKGKGTTATLLYKILKASHLVTGLPSGSIHLIGNMGIPMLDELPKLKKNSISIMELSSFQLQDMDVSPHIAVVLDISPDHLNYHKSMNEYLEAKAQLVKNLLTKPEIFQDFSQRDGGDLPAGRQGLSNSPARLAEAPAKRAGEYAGLEKSAGKAASVRSLWPLVFFFPDNKYSKQIAKKGKGKKIAVVANRRLKLKIPGAHNLKNASMAKAIGQALGLKDGLINRVISNFKGLPHRLEFVREVRCVKFYNDSASTNPGATVAALSAFKEPKILIAGGAGKNLDYKPIGKALKNSNTKLVVLCGQNKAQISNALARRSLGEGGVGRAAPTILVKDLRSAVNIAFQSAKKGDVIILSPASASFDQFSGYDERGDVFKKIVRAL